MTLIKDFSREETLEIFKDFLHNLHYAANVYMSQEKVKEGLKLVSEWSYAHRVGNGMLSQEESRSLIDQALIKMKEY